MLRKYTRAESYRVLTDKEREQLEQEKLAQKHAALRSLRTPYERKSS